MGKPASIREVFSEDGLVLVQKRCTVCEMWLLATSENFHKNSTGQFGLRARCKECRTEEMAQRYQNHKVFMI